MKQICLIISFMLGVVLVNGQTQNVGIGTSSPLEKLHVLGGQSRADNAQMGNGRNNDGRLKFLNSGWGRIGSADGLAFWADSLVDVNDNPAVYLDKTGRVGIGTTLLQKALLEVNGFVNHNPGNFVFYARDGGNNPITGGIGSQTIDISIYASSRVVAKEFDAHSDIRIKEVHGISDASADLKTLLGLEITDYSFIDKVQDAREQKKVIAQQVKKVFPQAVSLTTEVVPDIFQMGNLDGGKIKLENDLQAGERVRLVFPDRIEMVEVISADAESFQVNLPYEGEVFVYGREVKDFHVVDYTGISMLNVSATQAQQDLIENQAEEINRLKGELEIMKINQQSLEGRLLQIEASLSPQP